ncbi:aldehyde dehydrogenase family protein [Amycolatopsis lurida]
MGNYHGNRGKKPPSDHFKAGGTAKITASGRSYRPGIQEGTQMIVGGPELRLRLFRSAHHFSGVQSDMSIAQDEIIGPVLSILPHDTKEEAVEIANDSVYGLACGPRTAGADLGCRGPGDGA